MTSDGQTDALDEYHRIYDKAVKLLSLRLHTREELSRKLFRYNRDKTVINSVLDRLTELKVLDDEGFASIFVDNLIRYKTFGYYGLKAKLLSRGITSDMAEKLLSEHLSLENEIEIAKKFSKKKLVDPQRLAQALARKGFRAEVISRLLANDL